MYISNLSPNLLPTFLITLISLVLGSNPIPTCIKVWLWSPFPLVILDSGRAFTSPVAGFHSKVLSYDSYKQKIPLQQSTTRIAASIFSVNSMCLIAEASAALSTRVSAESEEKMLYWTVLSYSLIRRSVPKFVLLFIWWSVMKLWLSIKAYHDLHMHLRYVVCLKWNSAIKGLEKFKNIILILKLS